METRETSADDGVHHAALDGQPSAATPQPIRPAVADGSFRLLDEIDRGAMGIVYRGVAPDGSPLAVKVLHPEFSEDMQTRTRFATDAAVLSSVKHENVVHVHKLVVLSEPRDGLAIVMDLVEGTNLRHYLEAHAPLRPTLAAALTRQILSALVAVHRLGVVHRDVKPENVLLELVDVDRPHVRVTDFGIARVTGGNALTTNVTGAVLGTRDYIAPEFAHPGAKVTPQVDLYAAGLILYEMLTGHLPYRGDADPLAAVPRPLRDLLASLLAPFPAGRPASAEAAVSRLDAAAPDLEGLSAASGHHASSDQPATALKAARLERLKDELDRAGEDQGRRMDRVPDEEDEDPDATSLHARARAPELVASEAPRPRHLRLFLIVGGVLLAAAATVVALVGGAGADPRPIPTTTTAAPTTTTTTPATTSTTVEPTTTTTQTPPTSAPPAPRQSSTPTTVRRTTTTVRRTTATTQKTTQTTSCASHIPC